MSEPLSIDQVMRTSPVIPVISLDGSIDPAELARTYVANGLRVIEVTLRTPQALDCIRAMADVEGAIVGAGTVLNEAQLDRAIEAGSKFIVSPGLTEPLGKAAVARGIPFLPGIATAGDLMRGLDLGLDRFKFFPAEASGGRAALKAISAPFGNIRFCPTGGITPETAGDWLGLEAVLCVGGSWLLKDGESDFTAIGARARAAAALRQV
ncbi:MAG: bifunctional 4-hydroxy-2-oxoglutarate aldolase/2-dehydro-3-deoxy-phosphogluconate aldolase [Sphingomicrobium sp.]